MRPTSIQEQNSYAQGLLVEESGMTLVELLVGVGISAAVLTLIGTFIFQFFTVTRQGNARMDVTSDLQSLSLWLGRDSAEAYSFVPGSSPIYGTFHVSQSDGDHEYRYRFEAAEGRLVREHYLDGALQSSQTVSRHIASEGDVTFNASGSLVSVSVTATSGQISDSVDLELALRAESP